MIENGSFQTHSCRGVTRRAFVKAAASLPAAWGLAANAAGSAKAESVIVVWLWGGPSHLDTSDPKPNAPSEFRGPFAAIATQTPGVRFSEPFPRLADRSRRFSEIRSTMLSKDHGLGPLTGEAVAMG